jgi:hypothetical protein
MRAEVKEAARAEAGIVDQQDAVLAGMEADEEDAISTV